jgi:hypothetical protein
MRVRLGSDRLERIRQSNGNRGPSEWTTAGRTLAETTAMKIIGICLQTGLRNVETIARTTTMIVENTTTIVIDTHEG